MQVTVADFEFFNTSDVVVQSNQSTDWLNMQDSRAFNVSLSESAFLFDSTRRVFSNLVSISNLGF